MKCDDCDFGYDADGGTCKTCQGFGETPPLTKCLTCQRHVSKCGCSKGVLKMTDDEFGAWLAKVEADFLAQVEEGESCFAQTA